MRAVRRGILSLAGVVALAAAAWTWLRPPAPVRRAPGLSVLLVTIDTLRADAVGAYGSREGATPWLDRLAREGVRFEHASAHNVVTLPSHATILSGLTPLAHGIRDNSGFRFPVGRETLATLLKARGYRTAAFVSGFPLDSRFGLDRGFDVYDDRYGNADTPGAFVIQERRGGETASRAARWIAAQEGPWFCWVHLYDPHFPYEPPEPFAAGFAGRPYFGEVAAADAALGALLTPLVRAGVAAPALVVAMADHGESLGEHGEATHGIFAYEATLRVPLILWAPRLLRPRVVADHASLADVAPTVLDLLALPAAKEMEGRSLLSAAVGRSLPPKGHYFEALSASLNRGWAPLHGIRQGSLKYIDLPVPEVYDLTPDPGEEHNLATNRSGTLNDLRSRLQELRLADPGFGRSEESAEVRERLAALGYVTGAGAAPKPRYTEGDDPKRLIALDAQLQAVVELYRRGDVRGALALCETVVEKRPDMAIALSHLALLQRELGELGAAVKSLERSLSLTPGDTETVALLGNYLNEAGRSGEARALLQPYARREPPDVDVLIALGVAHANLGQAEGAVSSFERARAADPTNPLPMLNLATVHVSARRFDRARKELEAVLLLNPNLARAHNALGVVAAQTGRPEEAIEHWRRAVELDPVSFDTLFNLGSVLLRLGRREEARPYLDRFAREAPPAFYAGDIAKVKGWLARLGPGS
jgi:arylsulfatase A-like enzyme/Flp pilus assembly protein TadD